MPTPNDNSFSKDTIALREERLRAIENHRADTIPIMVGIHADLSAWMQNCHTVYSSLLTDAKVNDDHSRSQTIQRRIDKEALNEELQLAKEHIVANYADDEVRRRSFGIEGTMPSRPDLMVRLAEEVERLTAKHKADGFTKHMSDAQIARLHAAMLAVKASLKEGSEGTSDEDTTYTAAQLRYKQDTPMLKRLLAAWHSAVGKHDPRITLIGMVNTEQGGNSAHPGVPGLELGIAGDSLEIVPNLTRPAATSYQTYFRPTDGSEDWAEYANNDNTHLLLNDARLLSGTEYEFHSRARNANGVSDWSISVIVAMP